MQVQDGVIVETARGMEFGQVVIAPRSVDASEVVQPLKPIVRKATAKDKHQVEKIKNEKNEPILFALKRLQNINCP